MQMSDQTNDTNHNKSPTEKAMEYDYLIKFLALGDSGVGKARRFFLINIQDHHTNNFAQIQNLLQ
jgi:hypothetical protein